MAIVKLQGNRENELNIYYEFDTESKPLGEGGMGKVFRGKCVDAKTGTSRDVAIKFMFEGLTSSVIERARRESAIQLRHENLVEMMGFLTTEEEVPGRSTTRKHYHVVSELLDGVTLEDLLNGITTDSEGKTVEFAVEMSTLRQYDPYKFAKIILSNILSGVMSLHDAGYIHRDIDPSNIMLTHNRKIKLIDFGIAKKIETLATTDKELTVDGQFVGKVKYASPELILGLVKDQDKTTDIYSLGIMFYQLITGNVPFEGHKSEICRKHLQVPVPLKQIKHKNAKKIIRRATEKDQRKRFQSAAEFRVEIERMEEVSSQSTLSFDKRYILAAAACVLIGVIGFTAYWIFRNPGNGNTADSNRIYTLSDVKNMLMHQEEAKGGFNELERLCESKNGEAIYLMSRLYLLAGDEGEATDSVIRMQNNLKGLVSQDNTKAHELLEEAVQQNHNNCWALYDLGRDYELGEKHGSQVDMGKAKEMFAKAEKNAKETGDILCESACQKHLQND